MAATPELDTALSRFEESLRGPPCSPPSPFSTPPGASAVATSCCELLAAALLSPHSPAADAQARVKQLERCTSSLRGLFTRVQEQPELLPALLESRVVAALEALARAALLNPDWQSRAGADNWQAGALAVQTCITDGVLPAALAHARAAPPAAPCAPAAGACVTLVLSLAVDVAAPRTMRSGRAAPGLAAILWSSLAKAFVEAAPPPALVAGFAGRVAAAAARNGTRLLRSVCREPNGAHVSEACAVAGTLALQAGKLAHATPNAGAEAWDELVEGGTAARCAVAATRQKEPLTRTVVVRFDASLYRTLEKASDDACVRLLGRLCCGAAAVAAGGDDDVALSLNDALAAGAARCALFCDAVLARGEAQSSGLRAAAAAHLGWALRTAAHDCLAASLAVHPPAKDSETLRRTLLKSIGKFMAAAAAAAAASAEASAAWHASEAFLFDAAVSPHPLARSLALDAWAALVATSPPALCSQHVAALLALLHAAAAATPPTDILRVAMRRSSGAATSRAAGCGSLAAAASRLLGACPDPALVASTYNALFVAPADAFSAPHAAAALLCAGFPLRRLCGAAAAHATNDLPRAAAASASDALHAALQPGTGSDAAGAAAERLHCALVVARELCDHAPVDDMTRALAAGAALQVASRLAMPGQCGARTLAALSAARIEALHLAARNVAYLPASDAASLSHLLTSAAAVLPGARSALPLALLHCDATPGTPGVATSHTLVAASFRQRHWALVHAAVNSFCKLAARTPNGFAALRTAVPADAAVGDADAVMPFLRAVLRDSASAEAASQLASADEAAALDADADALCAALHVR